jgi:hypothetical protein
MVGRKYVDIFRRQKGFAIRKVWETLIFRNEREIIDELHRKLALPLENIERVLALRVLEGGRRDWYSPLSWAQDAEEWSCLHPCPMKKPPAIHWIGGWVGHRGDLDILGREQTMTDSLPGFV